MSAGDDGVVVQIEEGHHAAPGDPAHRVVDLGGVAGVEVAAVRQPQLLAEGEADEVRPPSLGVADVVVCEIGGVVALEAVPEDAGEEDRFVGGVVDPVARRVKGRHEGPSWWQWRTGSSPVTTGLRTGRPSPTAAAHRGSRLAPPSRSGAGFGVRRCRRPRPARPVPHPPSAPRRRAPRPRPQLVSPTPPLIYSAGPGGLLPPAGELWPELAQR